ncbi:MAG: DUF2058 family protein [Ectothiorhodospiraceae bacterium AqS1]|nr:DUF2058 family protein [Ectothiorhodospiraceae bacterium AqS1]
MKAGLAPTSRTSRSQANPRSGTSRDKSRRHKGGSQKRRSLRPPSPPSPSPAKPPVAELDTKPSSQPGEGEAEARLRLNAEIRRILDERSEKVDAKAGTVAFHFIRHGRIKRIHLTLEQRERLLRGELVVVGFRRSNHLVCRSAGERILSLRPEVSVFIADRSEPEHPSEEGYESFEVPDDLIW